MYSLASFRQGSYLITGVGAENLCHLAGCPLAALRAARLQIVGSGQGSVSTRAILTELPALAMEITEGIF